MAYQFMLVAAQAAGMAADLWADRRRARKQNQAVDSQINRLNQAFGISQEEIGAEMDQLALSSAESSYLNSQKLLEVMASNRAIAGARGQMIAGSAQGIAENAIRAFNADERARQISKTVNQYRLESNSRMMKINQIGAIGQLRSGKLQAKAARHANRFNQSLDMKSFNQVFGQFGKSGKSVKNGDWEW